MSTLGNVSLKLRAWQRRALDAYAEVNPRDWLVTATPGAGKTTYALATARHLWDLGRVRRVVVITPTDHLRNQWVQAGQGLGFDLRATPNDERLPADADGVVATYAQVAAAPRVHEARTANRPTVVVFDEIHHAGDDLQWGTAVVDAFDDARHRLAITGTPFRSDQARIPHIRYERTEQGAEQSVSDFTYGYRQALRDGVVRPVVFAAYSGTATWQNSAGDVLEGALGDPMLSRQDEDAAWKTALDPDGEWIPHVFAAMAHRIDQQRAGPVPDAAGMVLASNQQVARQYAHVWETVTGQRPLLILSDDPEASDNIRRFRDDPSIKAAVSVRMVSEGVDIPRATCITMSTTASTPLFFAQAVGRVVRARRRGETATVFLPAVRHLLGLAAELEQERSHVVEPPEEGELAPVDDAPAEQTADNEASGWAPLRSQAAFSQVIASQQDDQQQTREQADRDDYLGLPGVLTPEQESALLAKRDEENRRAAQTAAQQRRQHDDSAENVVSPAAATGGGESGQTADEEAAELRRQVASAVSSYAADRGVSHREAWATLYAKTPGPKNASASVRLLQRRLDVVRRL